jgi:Tn3 transposase DDE domain
VLHSATVNRNSRETEIQPRQVLDVIEYGSCGSRVNRITYEICVLEALREQLRCKEIWVVGANRYRNPDEDVPADFETQRTACYQVLNLPLEADRFVVGLQEEMHKALHTLDMGLARNPCVRINEKAGGWISVTPLTAQPEPANLAALRAEIAMAWPMTSLLGELASNRSEDHELSMLALHLLRNCMVYINSLMMQQVLARPHWAERLTATRSFPCAVAGIMSP